MGDPGDYRFAAFNVVTYLNLDLHVRRHQDVGARTEFNKPELLALFKFITFSCPTDYAAGHYPGDLCAADRKALRLDRQRVAFIRQTCIITGGRILLAWYVLGPNDTARDRGTINVDIERRHEYADQLSPFVVVDPGHCPVGRREYQPLAFGTFAIRVAKEIRHEQGNEGEYPGKQPELKIRQEHCDQCGDNNEGEAFLDHKGLMLPEKEATKKPGIIEHRA